MSKTSIKDYVEAGIIGSCIIAVIVLCYVLADPNYDIQGIDTSSFNAYGNFTKMTQMTNESVSKVYDTNAESGLFDILGDLVVKALASIKSFIQGINFMTESVDNMLGSGLFYIPPPIKVAIVTLIVLSIGAVILFKYLSGKEDEK